MHSSWVAQVTVWMDWVCACATVAPPATTATTATAAPPIATMRPIDFIKCLPFASNISLPYATLLQVSTAVAGPENDSAPIQSRSAIGCRGQQLTAVNRRLTDTFGVPGS